MITDIKFGLDQDRSKNSVLNLQVHVPPNQDYQTLNFCFFGDSPKEGETGRNDYKPFMGSTSQNIQIALTKRSRRS